MDELTRLMKSAVDNRLEQCIEVFTYIRDHPILLLQPEMKQVAYSKIIQMREFIRKQHEGFDQVVLAHLTHNTEKTKTDYMDYYIMSRSYHPLQNVMDDVWELLQD